jgi:hypothetical protein
MMSATERRVTRADIMAPSEYAAKRNELRKSLVAMKKNRRMEVGPFATFHFESYETMWQQIQEMLHIEKGGEEQVAGELEAYNPLIPQGNELIATLMLEIEDASRRNRELYRLAGIEEATYIELADHRVAGRPTEYDERTTPDGKTSSVHWVRFTFTDVEKKKLADPSVPAILGVAHAAYGHMAVIPPAVRAALVKDFA